MAIESIKALGTKMISKISAKKAEKVGEIEFKNGERMLATGQDAAAIQGRAMVKPYEKPTMEKVNLRKENTQAASSTGFTDETGGDIDIDDDFSSSSRRSSSIWDDAW